MTDIGRRRPNNEDAFHIDPDAGFFVLADGMGGAPSGEIASRIFVETARELFSGSSRDHQSEQETLELVRRSFQVANDRTIEHARRNPFHTGMGCTAELLAFNRHKYVLGHVGDSRTYLFRHGTLRKATTDHSVVQEQFDRGLITAEVAGRHPLRNVVSRAVGVAGSLEVDFVLGEGRPGDILLLCSDGLSDAVSDAEIGKVLSLPVGLGERVEMLIAKANEAGGHDNVTVILCEVAPPPAGEPAGPARAGEGR